MCRSKNLAACIISDSLLFSVGFIYLFIYLFLPRERSDGLRSEPEWLREGKREGIRSWVHLESDNVVKRREPSESELVKVLLLEFCVEFHLTSAIYSRRSRISENAAETNLVGQMQERLSLVSVTFEGLYLTERMYWRIRLTKIRLTKLSKVHMLYHLKKYK